MNRNISIFVFTCFFNAIFSEECNVEQQNTLGEMLSAHQEKYGDLLDICSMTEQDMAGSVCGKEECTIALNALPATENIPDCTLDDMNMNTVAKDLRNECDNLSQDPTSNPESSSGVLHPSVIITVLAMIMRMAFY